MLIFNIQLTLVLLALLLHSYIYKSRPSYGHQQRYYSVPLLLNGREFFDHQVTKRCVQSHTPSIEREDRYCVDHPH